MEVPGTTSCKSYYLEFGVLPIGALKKARRINYLHSRMYTLAKEERNAVFFPDSPMAQPKQRTLDGAGEMGFIRL